MTPFSRNFYAVSLALLMISGVGACASKPKAATGPDAKGAAGTSDANAKNQDALEKKRQADAEAERQKQLELDKLKAEEDAKNAANVLRPEDLANVYFEFDKYDIKANFRTPLQQDASAIEKHSSAKVVVEGYCDERGSEEYNLALGERRATSVKKYLASLGVNEGQLRTISYGEEKPADPGHNEKAWAKNRRVHFSLE